MAWQFRGHSPVYRQIVRHIRANILNGCYQPDEQIPPVRQLAMEAGVNPNTMQKAHFIAAPTLDDLFSTDAHARRLASEML